MLSTPYFQFWWEMTGCLIERETKTPNPTAPADYTSQYTTIYSGINKSRIVDLTKSKTQIDEYDKQNGEAYLLYLDREFVGIIKEGDRVKWRRDEMGMNLPFVNNQTENVLVGYIRRVVNPQNQSINGSVECYITTNN